MCAMEKLCLVFKNFLKNKNKCVEIPLSLDVFCICCTLTTELNSRNKNFSLVLNFPKFYYFQTISDSGSTQRAWGEFYSW